MSFSEFYGKFAKRVLLSPISLSSSRSSRLLHFPKSSLSTFSLTSFPFLPLTFSCKCYKGWEWLLTMLQGLPGEVKSWSINRVCRLKWVLSEHLWLALLWTAYSMACRKAMFPGPEHENVVHSFKEYSLSIYYIVGHFTMCQNIAQNDIQRSWQEDSNSLDKK